MTEQQIGHTALAALAVIGIIVLQVMGKGQPDIYALLGGIAGFSGQTSAMLATFGPDDEETKK